MTVFLVPQGRLPLDGATREWGPRIVRWRLQARRPRVLGRPLPPHSALRLNTSAVLAPPQAFPACKPRPQLRHAQSPFPPCNKCPRAPPAHPCNASPHDPAAAPARCTQCCLPLTLRETLALAHLCSEGRLELGQAARGALVDALAQVLAGAHVCEIVSMCVCV